MPEEDYTWLPREQLLSFEEIERLVRIMEPLGVEKVRLTGGEPLLRRDLAGLLSKLSARPGLRDIALTTNGVTLAEHASALCQAGLSRVTISLDTLQPERFRALTRRDSLPKVLEGIQAATRVFRSVKLNTVLMRGVNDDEMFSLVEFARQQGVELRFIEYMDVGGATHWESSRVLPREEMLQRLAARYGAVEALSEGGSAPAERFRLPGGLVVGVIASTSTPFCGTCDRARLTADGTFFLCLYARRGLDLRKWLRNGSSDEEITAAIGAAWSARSDRGAEQRLAVLSRGPLASRDELRQDPRLEMHTRGG
jgi:cyclic pyranopterin phosphate synthase